MHEAKTYRQYIEQTPFESVWGVLRVQYGEIEDVVRTPSGERQLELPIV